MTTVPAVLENQDSPLDIADAVLPAFDGYNDLKRNYLSYRLCGFGRNESCRYVSIHPRTVNNWKNNDPEFRKIEETNLLSLRKQFSKVITLFEFTRNFRLTLGNDTAILDKVRRRGVAALNKDEKEYFIKMRSMYTPQQYSVLEELFEGKNPIADFDWAIYVRGKGELPASAQAALQDN